MEVEAFMVRLMKGQSLEREEARKLMNYLISEDCSEVERATFLTGLYFKDATSDEIIGFSESLREHAIHTPIQGLTDIVGTGGDGKNTINVSTAASIVSSALGVRVAKHGNIGITSSHGSADFMKYIGYNFDAAAVDPTETLKRDGFLYVFAPRFNQSFARFAGVRKKIGHRTVFNIMGPITNPFDPDRLVIGTADPGTARALAEVLVGKGKKGYVFHSSDGLDEISPEAETRGYAVNGSVSEVSIFPEDITGRKTDLRNVVTPDPEQCFIKTLRGLSGRDKDASVFIALNAAPALVLNEFSSSLEDGYLQAMNAIEEGTVLEKVRKLAGGRITLNEVS